VNQPAPIIFIHSGESWYLPYALHAARHADPAAGIFLLGDAPPAPGFSHRKLADCESDASRRFRKIFREKSLNPSDAELVCYLRWFYLANFLKQEKFQDAFYYDSDVLVYSAGDEVKRTMLNQETECGLSLGPPSPGACEWIACGHASYWQAAILEEFCDFCIRSHESDFYLERYRQKLDWNRKAGAAGSISDMTTLYFFWENNRHRIANLSVRKNGAVVDNNVSISDIHGTEYLMENGIKKIRFQNGKPHIFLSPSAEPVLAHSLHFQGGCKRLMPDYYQGPAFKKKWLLPKPTDGKLVGSCKKRVRSIKRFFGGV
jgi:hypothetical protein